jgi:hypothetical protein
VLVVLALENSGFKEYLLVRVRDRYVPLRLPTYGLNASDQGPASFPDLKGCRCR